MWPVTHLQTSASTRDTQSQGSTVSDVRVVALSQKLYNAWDLCVVSEKDETEGGHSCSSNIIRDIGDSDVEQFTNGLVVTSTGVSESDSEHGAIS
jgi:hypothetical protein